MGPASRDTGRSRSYRALGKEELGSEAHQHGRDSVFWRNLRRQEEPASAKSLVRKPRRPPPLIPSHGPAILPGISPVEQTCVWSCCVRSWQGTHFWEAAISRQSKEGPCPGTKQSHDKGSPSHADDVSAGQTCPVEMEMSYQRQVSGGRKGDWNMRRCHSE